MRILHIDPDDIDNPMGGGGPIRTLEICRRLAARHEITVLTPTFEGSTPEIVRDGVRYVRVGRKVGDHGSSHHITFFFALPAAICRRRFDLLVEDFMPPLGPTLDPLFTRKPVIASVQWMFARALGQQYKLPFHWGERLLTRLYSNFVTPSQASADRIAALAPRARCAVVANGIDASLLEGPLRAGQGLLFLGRIDMQQKGVDLLLEALAGLPSERRPPLVLAGHGFEEDAVRALVGRLGLTPWVRFFGRYDAAQRAELLAACRCVCIPSREETFGMVIAEACAAGKPVVVWDLAPMNAVAAPDCRRVPPFDVAAYGRALLAVIEQDDAALVASGQRCRAWAQRFRWDELALQQERFYLEVAGRGA